MAEHPPTLHEQWKAITKDIGQNSGLIRAEIELLLREKNVLNAIPTINTVGEDWDPSNPVAGYIWKKQLLKAKRMGGNWAVVTEIQQAAKLKKGTKGKTKSWDCLLEDDSLDRMYTYLSVCEASHGELVESLITGTTAWKASRDKDFGRSLDLHHAIQVTGMGVYYNTQVSSDKAEGLSYDQMERVCDGIRIYMDSTHPGSVALSTEVDAVMLSAGSEDRKTDDEREKLGMRRYRRKPDDKPTKKALAWQEKMRKDILEPACKALGRNSAEWVMPRVWGIPEIGWAKSVAQRANAHIVHVGTNDLWGLFTAMSCALFESDGTRLLNIQQYCLCRVINEEDKNLLEAMFSMLTGSYYFFLGLNPTLAGGIHDLKSGKADHVAKDRIIDQHFAANNVWVKERAQLGATQDMNYMQERLDKLKWWNGTMEEDIKTQRDGLEELLNEVNLSIKKTAVHNRQLDLNDAMGKAGKLKLAFE